MKKSMISIVALALMMLLPACGGSNSSDTPSGSNGIQAGNGVNGGDDVEEVLGKSLNYILQPISDLAPAGSDITRSDTYRRIKRARYEDDASLPMGAWEWELKRANWNSEASLSLDALATRSKDLQLAAWLLEGKVHLKGFEALSPSLKVLRMLSRTYWDDLYPADMEQRMNIIRWVDKMLTALIRIIPITAEVGGRSYSLADREQAIRNEQIKATLPPAEALAIEGPTLEQYNAAVAATPAGFYDELRRNLDAAHDELHNLSADLEELIGDEAPTLGSIANTVEYLIDSAGKEIHLKM